MMRRVYKYELPITDSVWQTMPAGAEILYVGNQYEKLCLWALVDPDAPPVTRHLRVTGTGHPVEEPVLRHLGSAQFAQGDFIFHVFEVTQ